MPQVSRRKLEKDVMEKILATLFESLLKINDGNLVKEFLDDFLTPTEKIMLAKRLAAAYFLEQGHGYRFISEVLKMSPTTVNTVHKQLILRGAGYRGIFRLISQRTLSKNGAKPSRAGDIMERLEEVISAFIPPIKGSKSSYRRYKNR
ncbi:MAG: hypothetical protein A2934_05710 [Candidatus Sungbacteria bacterium RIFCSPLOWO2_01_FULL_47_10]|uniref:TrpR like protein, YerC/YecD n=1 Tax=Candidatus Sungbacteria bacterium RIFCSPLOWO2_01_FULL_47_10 TaxID=1802276 RepID=A0A1G2L3C5_9BACT|nr:MAG: hypothetical protein A2934_05710 [Candidatus Sungbacteria bacterium RIFCSPLOWO2_01_FULL_47_10]